MYVVITSDEVDKDVQSYVRETLAVSGKNTYVQMANENGSKVFVEMIENAKQGKEYDVLYPDNPAYIGMKKTLEQQGYDVSKLTMPVYNEYDYDPSDNGLLIDYTGNEKVELGTYTYKKAVYHSETLTDKGGNKTIYCYNNSNKLCLIVEVDTEDGTEDISIVNDIQYTVNPSVFNLNPNAVNADELEEKGIIVEK